MSRKRRQVGRDGLERGEAEEKAVDPREGRGIGTLPLSGLVQSAFILHNRGQTLENKKYNIASRDSCLVHGSSGYCFIAYFSHWARYGSGPQRHVAVLS